MRKNLRRISNVLLLITALIWGVAFVAQSVAMDSVKPWSFILYRFVIAGVLLLPLSYFSQKPYESSRIPEEGETKGSSRTLLWLSGAACGLFLGFASILQQMGLMYTTTGKAGFITALYIILVPILGLFFHQRPRKIIWIGALIAISGFYFIAIQAEGGFSIGKGDFLVLLSSFLYACQILTIDHVSGRVNPVLLSNIEFLFAALVGGVGMLLFESLDLAALRAAIIPILYVGVLSSAVGYTLQNVAQRYTEPTVASLLMSMESVFSALAGWLILGQKMSFREIMGCSLVFIAVILVQLPEKKVCKDTM